MGFYTVGGFVDLSNLDKAVVSVDLINLGVIFKALILLS